MAYTDTDLQAVEAAIASGERRVQFADGRSVEYRGVEELKSARALILTEMTTATTGRRSRFTRCYQSGDGR